MAQTNIDINLLFNEGGGLNKVVNELTEVKKLVDAINSTNIKIQGSMSADEIEKLSKKVAELHSQLNATKKDAKDGLVDKANVDAAANSIDGLKARVKQLKKELGGLDLADKFNRTRVNAEIEGIEQNIKRLATEGKKGVNVLVNSIGGLKDRVKQLKAEVDGLDLADKFNRKRINAEIQSVEQNIKRLTVDGKKDFNTFGNALKSFGFKFNVMANLVSRTTSVAIQSIRQLFRSATESVVDFDRSQSLLAALSGKTKEEIADLTKSARELGASTAFTANEVSELQIELKKLGFTTDEILAAQKGIIGLSTAFGIDVARAAEVAGSSLRGFNLDANQSQRVSDVLTKSFAESSLNLEKYAVAASKVAPISSKLGISFEGTVALLGKLSDAGFDASTSGTALRNIMIFLADSSSKLSKEIGKPINSLESLVDAFRDLSAKGLSLDDVFKLSNRRTVAPLQSLIDQADGIQAFNDVLLNAAGTSQQFQDEILKSISGTIELMTSAWDDLILTIDNGEGSFSETTKSIARLLTEVFNLAAGSEKLESELDEVGLSIRRKAEFVVMLTRVFVKLSAIFLTGRGLIKIISIYNESIKASRAAMVAATAATEADTAAKIKNDSAVRTGTKGILAFNRALSTTALLFGTFVLSGIISIFSKIAEDADKSEKAVKSLNQALSDLSKANVELSSTTVIGQAEAVLARGPEILKERRSATNEELEAAQGNIKAQIEVVNGLLNERLNTEQNIAKVREGILESGDASIEAAKLSLSEARATLEEESVRIKAQRIKTEIVAGLTPVIPPVEDNKKLKDLEAIIESANTRLEGLITQRVNIVTQGTPEQKKAILFGLKKLLDGVQDELKQRGVFSEVAGIIAEIDSEIKTLNETIKNATNVLDIEAASSRAAALQGLRKEIISGEATFQNQIEKLGIEAIDSVYEKERESLILSRDQKLDDLEIELDGQQAIIDKIKSKEGVLSASDDARLFAANSLVTQINEQITLNNTILNQKLELLRVERELSEIEKNRVSEVSRIQIESDAAALDAEIRRLQAIENEMTSFNGFYDQKVIDRKEEAQSLDDRQGKIISSQIETSKNLRIEEDVLNQLKDQLKTQEDNNKSTIAIGKTKEAISASEKTILELGQKQNENTRDQLLLDKDADSFRRKVFQEQLDLIKQQRVQMIELAEESAGAFFDILERTFQMREELATKQLTIAENNIDRQQRLAEKGFANTLAFEKRRSQELQKIQADQVRNQARIDKARALFSLLASYAKDDPNGALGKAFRDVSLAEAATAATFEKGGVIGDVVDRDGIGGKVRGGIFQGRSHKTGGIIIEAERDEAILSRKAVAGLGANNFGALQYALESGTGFEFQKQSELLSLSTPILRADNTGMERRLERIERAIKEKPVSSAYIDNVGDVITEHIERGVRTVTKRISKKPRLK